MKINRTSLLELLNVASVGLTARELLEQSNAFVFHNGELITFNGEILTRVTSPLEDVEGAVSADDFYKLLSKFPDDEVEIFVKGEEIRVKAGKRSAGMRRGAEVFLPYSDVPRNKTWHDAPAGLMGTLLQAARVCGRDETQPRTTEVHVTPDRIEASDNFRLFQCMLETGFEAEALLPATSVEKIGAVIPKQIAHRGGWFHVKNRDGHKIAVRCSSGDYPDLEPHLQVEDQRKVVLPKTLVEILSRASVMHETAFDACVTVKIEEGQLTLTAKKETGWYRESEKVKYRGPALRFDVHPKFLEDVLSKTRTVRIGGNRMKIATEDTTFVVCLEMGGEDE